MKTYLQTTLQKWVTGIIIATLVLPSAPFFSPQAHATGAEADAQKLAQAQALAFAGATEQTNHRTAKSRTYQAANGRGWTEVHSESIHYQDGQGSWQQINNNLATDQSNPPNYFNSANRYRAQFSQALGNNFFTLQQNNQQAYFTLLNSLSSQAVISANSLTYPNALSSIDLRYTIGPDSVKSELILKAEPATRTIVYQAVLPAGWQASVSSGDVKISDTNGALVWLLPKPSITQPITGEPVFTDYTIQLVSGSTYNITLAIPGSFLPPAERGYPVVIDPSVIITDGANTATNYVLEGQSGVTFKNLDALPVGNTTYGESRGFLKFDTGSIPSGQVIDGATFGITMQEERASIPRIKLYNVTQNWDPNTLNWSNQPSVGSTFEDSYAHDVTYAWWNFDVSNLVKGWYANTTPNYGFSLRGHDPDVSRRNFLSKYYSSNPERQFNPYIIVYHHPQNDPAPTPPSMLGSKPWWRYVSTPLAFGTGAVNVANGNLVFNFNDVSVQDQGLDVSLSHTYNAQDNYDDKFGYGWTISANKRLIPSQDRKTVIYVDETGTSFTFKDEDSNGNYIDNVFDASSGFYKRPNHRPNGLTWGLKYNSGTNRYTAISSSKMTYTFDGEGKILEEKDRNNNKITYSYTSGNLTSIEGNSGKKVKLYYDAGRLSKVEDYNTEDPTYQNTNGGVVTYLYDNGDLKTLKFEKYGQQNPIATITFNYTNHRLDSIVDARANTTSFSYDANKRVTDVYDAENKRTNINYEAAGLTKVTTPKFYEDGGDQEKYLTDYSYRTNPYYQTGLVYRELGPKLTNNQGQSVRNKTEYDYNDDFLLHATTDPANNVEASAYDDISGLLFYQYDENNILTLKNSYAISNYDNGDWRLVDTYSGNGTQTTFQYDSNGNLTRKGVLDGNINLVHNPGFESTVRDPNAFDLNCGSYVKQGVADFWCGSGVGSNNRVYGIDTGTFTDGTKSQYVGFNNNTSAGSVNVFQTIDEATRPLPDKDYVLTWKHKNEISSNFFIQIAVIHYDTRGNQIGSTILDPNQYSSSNWEEKYFSFHTPTTNSQTGLPYWTSEVFMRARSNTTGTVAKAWFDSVSLERGTTPSPRTEKVTTFTYTDAFHPTPTGLPLTETTPEGKESKYDWDNRGNLLKVTDSLSKDTTYTYDANGNKLSKVDPNGNETVLDPDDFKFTYTYDTRGRILSIKEVKPNRQTTYQYDPNGNLLETVTPNNLKTTYAYDKVNRSKTTVNAYGYESKVEYDAQGNPKGITDPNSRTSSASYDANDRITIETNPQGQNTDYKYDNTDNLKKVDENGKSHQYDYDKSGQVTKETNDQTGQSKTIEYQYDNNGNVTIINNQTGETINHTYSATDEVTIVTVGGLTTKYTRNKNNQLTKLEKPNSDVVDYFYDNNARVTKIEHSRGGNIFLKYEYQYDANGNRTQIKTTQNGGNPVTVDYEYDNLNQLKKIIAASKTTTYTYDAGGNITQIAETPGTTTDFTYDGNRLIKKTVGASTEYFGYDAGGNMTSRDTADRVDFLAHFNNNLINARDNQPGKAENPNSNYTPVYETGKFNQAVQLDSQTNLSYSSSSNLNKDTGTVEMWVKPHWTSDTNLRVFFDYYVDANNYLRFQKKADNALEVKYSRNGTSFILYTAQPVTFTSGTWYHLAFTWSPTGPGAIYVNGVSKQVLGTTYPCQPGQSCPPPPFVGRSPKITFGATTALTNYADISLDEIRISSLMRTATEINNSFNAAAEFTLPNTTVYEYDAHDYLTKISQPNGTVYEYKYDANKRRSKRIKTGATDINYQYDGAKLTTELNNDNSVIAKYSYDSQGQLLKITRGNDNYYPVTDGLGGIIQVRDSNGNVVNSYEYDEWGTVLNKTEQFPLSIRYAGYWQDNDTGLYHLGARWYDTSLFRFTSKDSHPGNQDDSSSLNEYLYVSNNPLIHVDPDGKFLQAAVGAAILIGSAILMFQDINKFKDDPNAKNAMMVLLGVTPMGKANKGKNIAKLVQTRAGALLAKRMAEKIIASKVKELSRESIKRPIPKDDPRLQEILEAMKGLGAKVRFDEKGVRKTQGPHFNIKFKGNWHIYVK